MGVQMAKADAECGIYGLMDGYSGLRVRHLWIYGWPKRMPSTAFMDLWMAKADA